MSAVEQGPEQPMSARCARWQCGHVEAAHSDRGCLGALAPRVTGQCGCVSFVHPTPPAPDLVNHPPHYTSHPSGVECISITEHFAFNIGNAIKYLWRAGLKGDTVADLRKAAWYVHREIARIEARSS